MSNQDKRLIEACTSDDVVKLFSEPQCEHPMDNSIIDKLRRLEQKIRPEDDDYQLFRYRDETNELWGLLLEKAIKCLRFFDAREPFQGSDGEKVPKAYGIDDLKKYYRKYAEFERILYGSNRYYRDHVIHVLRTWLSGIELLTKNNGACLEKIAIQEKKIAFNLNKVEKISMWTIIALTHDLGYPLEKAKSIIDVTQDMVSTFITNPDISVDFSFRGVQNYMNDFVVRLMSSKMEERENQGKGDDEEEQEKKPYVARLQPKYYFKFQKSLERNSHGILSTLIIYKLLTYFLESDYSINEDYRFNEEECRQFYIRREMLRAIASHTCDDVYQMYMGSFSFLLRICDDTQEWGRKNISELYVKSEQGYELEDIDLSFGSEPKTNRCTIREQTTVPDKESVTALIHRFREQALVYVTIFRDGQDTTSRDFSFQRILSIKAEEISLVITLEIDNNRASQLDGSINYISNSAKNEPYGQKFFESLSRDCDWKILDRDGQDVSVSESKNWNKGTFTIPLSN